MSQDNKKSFVMYQGDGSNNVFSVPMTKGKYGTISVAFVRRGLDQYEYDPDTWGLNGGLFAWDLSGTKVYTDTATPAIGATIYDQYGVDTGDTVTAVGGATITVNTNVYTRDTLHDVDENTVLTWTGDTLQIGDYIVIERTTTRTQPFEFQNNQKHIEKSDDNLERQIQEVADKVDNALLVDPTHTIDSNKMNPVEWMQTILRSVDKSVRGFRYLNGWLDYSLDDPNIADVDKTWTHLVNTDNIKAIREQSRIENNETIYYTEYLAQDGSWKILSDPHKWDNMKLSDLADTDFTNLSAGNFIMFDGLKWKNVFSTVAMFWGDMQGDISDQTDLVAEFAKKVNKSGDTMTGDLSFQYNTNNPVLRIIQSGQNTNHLRFINNNSASQSISFDLTQAAIHPLVTGRGHLGTSSIHFGDAYIDTIYTGVVNNGYDITVPVTEAADSFALESEITDINGKIPAQASTTNQLADKNFVNSSIATNTADFKGTYNSLADLEAVTADNNDYGFVVSTDGAGNTVYARYKYNGTSWVFEYNLNNSSFTSNQWATINSGATSNDVSLARSSLQPGDVGNGTITINQGGATKGTFTTNQGGNTTIELDAGSDGSYHPDLFDHKWADHICNDAQWLRADTFSWQSGSVYEVAYQHLCDDIVGKTGISDTIAGITVWYLLADDGHKICGENQESAVQQIYEATGVAWYYILDQTNHRFKLPRTKFGFTGIRSGVGGFVNAGLPNISVTGAQPNIVVQSGAGTGSGALNTTGDTDISYTGGGSAHTWLRARTLNLAISYSNSIYGNSDTVQPKATEMYLYFYVGNFTQTALENTAGLNTEMFNDLNAHKIIAFQAPTAANGYTWYRKYADGWVEQGCLNCNLPAQSEYTGACATLSFPIVMAGKDYHTTWAKTGDGGNTMSLVQVSVNRQTTYCEVWFFSSNSTSSASIIDISVSGMAAS